MDIPSKETIAKSDYTENIMVRTRMRYCPECFNIINVIDGVNGNPKCSCGWTDEVYDLLTREESISLSRIKLIDDIL